MNETGDWRKILTILKNLNGVDKLKQLFVDELNYDYKKDQELLIEFPKSINDKIHSTKII